MKEGKALKAKVRVTRQIEGGTMQVFEGELTQIDASSDEEAAKFLFAMEQKMNAGGEMRMWVMEEGKRAPDSDSDMREYCNRTMEEG